MQFRALVLLLVLGPALLECKKEELTGASKLARRKPKLFYISSSTTTSTLTTSTVCYVSSTAAPVACTKRKRRAMVVEPDEEINFDERNVSQPEQDRESDYQLGVEPGRNGTVRDARFLLYWATLTSTATTTSYSATLSLASLHCTPTGFPYSLCG